MIRSFAATAALIAAATLMSSGAQACLSCEYVPEVVRPHATSPLAYGRGDNAVSHGSSGSYSVKRRAAKIVEEPRQEKVAKRKVEKPEKVAKISKPEPEKVAKVSQPEPVKVAKADPGPVKSAESENSAITVAVAAAEPEKKDEPVTKAEVSTKPTDCKKFFASVGMTLTVPCEQ